MNPLGLACHCCSCCHEKNAPAKSKGVCHIPWAQLEHLKFPAQWNGKHPDHVQAPHEWWVPSWHAPSHHRTVWCMCVLPGACRYLPPHVHTHTRTHTRARACIYHVYNVAAAHRPCRTRELLNRFFGLDAGRKESSSSACMARKGSRHTLRFIFSLGALRQNTRSRQCRRCTSTRSSTAPKTRPPATLFAIQAISAARSKGEPCVTEPQL